MKFTSFVVALWPLVAASTIRSADRHPTRDARVDYNGYHVYRVSTANAPSNLESILQAYHSIDLKGSVQVAVPPSDVQSFEALGLETQLVSSDLGKEISAEALAEKAAPLAKRGELPALSWYDSYHSYDDHVKYWKDLHAAFPNNSEWLDIGSTYEGRNIFGLRLWGGNDTGTKPAVLWHGTVHAREWITTMVSSPPHDRNFSC